MFRLINTAHRGKGNDIWVATLPFVPLLPLRSLDFSIQYLSAAVLRATPGLLAYNLVKSSCMVYFVFLLTFLNLGNDIQLDFKTDYSEFLASQAKELYNQHPSVTAFVGCLPSGTNRDWLSVNNNQVLALPPPAVNSLSSSFLYPVNTKASTLTPDVTQTTSTRLLPEQVHSLFVSDIKQFKRLDFSPLSLEDLADLVLECFLAGKASPWEDPPPSFCHSYKLLRQWGRMSGAQKQAAKQSCSSYDENKCNNDTTTTTAKHG